jgi:hypothetical protein
MKALRLWNLRKEYITGIGMVAKMSIAPLRKVEQNASTLCRFLKAGITVIFMSSWQLRSEMSVNNIKGYHRMGGGQPIKNLRAPHFNKETTFIQIHLNGKCL